MACSFCIRRKIRCVAGPSKLPTAEPCLACVSRGIQDICTYREHLPVVKKAAHGGARKAAKATRDGMAGTQTVSPEDWDSNSSGDSQTLDSDCIAIAPGRTQFQAADFPNSRTFNLLLSLYKNELGPILFDEPFPGAEVFEYSESSPLVRMAMVCLASRYCSRDINSGSAIYHHLRESINPSLVGDLQPSLEVCRALLYIVAFLRSSSDSSVSFL